MITPQKLILQAREIVGELTPLTQDCGQLCGGACCRGEDAGMLVFPGEAELLSQHPDYRMFRIRQGGERVWLVTCPGYCQRETRPLACRIFPLLPQMDADKVIGVALDRRAKGMCPLSKIEQLNPEFCQAAHQVFALLAEQPKTRSFLQLIDADNFS